MEPRLKGGKKTPEYVNQPFIFVAHQDPRLLGDFGWAIADLARPPRENAAGCGNSPVFRSGRDVRDTLLGIRVRSVSGPRQVVRCCVLAPTQGCERQTPNDKSEPRKHQSAWVTLVSFAQFHRPPSTLNRE